MVHQRRDPALLSSAGPGRVLLQLFPVAARSTGRVRVGFTAPLVMEAGRVLLRLPAIVERNYDVPDSLMHGIRIEVVSGGASRIGTHWTTEPHGGEGALVRGDLPERALLAPPSATLALGPAPAAGSIAVSLDADGGTVQTLVSRQEAPRTPRIVLVVDLSASVGASGLEWSQVLARWPAGVPILAIAAGDAVDVLEATTGDEILVRWLGGRRYAGGIDPVPALERAWDEASRWNGAAIIWVHGVNPVPLSTTDGLRARLDRRRGGPPILAVSAAEGPNVILADLEGRPGLHVMPRLGRLVDDLARTVPAAGLAVDTEVNQTAAEARTVILDDLVGPVVRILNRRSRARLPAGAHQTSDHLGRLYAHEESMRLARSGRTGMAADLALRYRLVTPLTGAVVLERKEDYAAHGLDPARASAVRVRAVPEPEILLLVSVSTVVLLWRRRSRPGARPAP